MSKLLVKIKKIQNYIYNFLKINPHRHWNFLVRIFLSLAIILTISSLFILYRIKKEKIFQVKIEKIEKKSLLKESLLKNTLELFKNREIKELEIKKNGSLYSDPSI